MSAKEMFYNLGLKCVQIDYDEELVTRIMYHNNGGERVIITKNSIEYVYKYSTTSLNPKYLPAIVQQYKEFGWLNKKKG